jgi:hypothetical protein
MMAVFPIARIVILGHVLYNSIYPVPASPYNVLPYLAAAWLILRLRGAGFTVQQTLHEYPQVVAHYQPSAGYFPLAWWPGFAVLCGYAAVVLSLAVFRQGRRTIASRPQAEWR